ncbi:Imm51 family immunity protein [Paenibacillus sp. GCM10027626]|uniref:Imm51 family immunity protein n=1 Tax=Paenibacillus sp. GCM10027626 TaxID=3273411 RepID=UPI003629ACAD
MRQELLHKLNKWHTNGQSLKIVEAIEEIPESERDYEIVNHYGRALNNLDRHEEALQQLMTVKEQGQQDWLWHFRVGYAYYYLDRFAEALEAFEHVERLEPGDADTLYFIKDCHKEMSRRQPIKPEMDIPFRERDFSQFWEQSDYADESYVEEPPTADMIASVEEELGYKLPEDYIWLMKQQNGGIPVNTCFPTSEHTSWAEDHIAITGIMGIGREKAYSLCGKFGSPFMIEEWGYPDIGVVICDCPSAGHDVVMLDYRACGKEGEPAVVHVDQEADYEITFLAPNFAAFITGLVNEEVFDTSEQDKLDDLHTVQHGQFSPLLAQLCAKVHEVKQIEAVIRTICKQIVEDKGFFAFHADEHSMLMYDVQFWLYTVSYPEVTREQYLEEYKNIIVFGQEFSTGGYAPAFISDWLDDRLRQGKIVENGGVLSFTASAAADLIDRLNAVEISLEPFDITEQIKPFVWVEHDSGNVSMILNVGSYKEDIFETRADEGFEGNGYDWGSLAAVFLEEKMPELTDIVRFDPEADMFCAYSNQKEALCRFAAGFKQACEDDELIRDLFSRAILD